MVIFADKVDPIIQTLEVYELYQGKWVLLVTLD